MIRHKVGVFGGTSSSLDVCDWLKNQSIDFRLSVATSTGLEVAKKFTQESHVGRMNKDDMIRWFRKQSFSLIIDAAHPYAQVLHETVIEAATVLQLPIVRFDRLSDIQTQQQNEFVHVVESVDEACKTITQLNPQRVLLTTGSKNLQTFCDNVSCSKLYARVLPNQDAIHQCVNSGLELDEIIAIKGPFSTEFNAALYKELSVDLVVTKESGSAGGFNEKVLPCLALGIHCVVIVRPTIDSENYKAIIYQCSDLSLILSHL